MKKSLLVILALVAAVANARTIEIDDLMRVVSVSDPQISPDGKWIACVVSRPDVAEDRYDAEIVLVDVASGRQRTLTYDRKHVNSPRWSPVGDRLAFLADVASAKDKEPKTQLYVMPMSGSPYNAKYAKAYIEQSPITYAGQIKTPTLIITDTGDTRVPATQSFEMYHALKDNGVEVKFIAYPVGGHFPGDPVRSADVYRRWSEWIATHFEPAH